MSDLVHPDVLEPASPEDNSNFRRSLQFNMKELVGDAVGNMSISPASRDVVLATRNGLFIIDLEAPFNVPRFLPQGGTWDVADVQWNPHAARSEYIVSTSSEKLLIWNLFMTGRTSIEHVLRSHYRAITDINWHTTDPDVVVSTGIDSWLWAWDLRTIQKPVMGLCAFGSGGTQVKWNRQDGNLLASSHQNEVLLWDRRKGTLPISCIQAHNAKIYGIDWAHDRRNEIVTCSLDKSIKVWDTQTLEPKLTINTPYPVWRARDLPFGRGLLSLPQRGETALEMYSHDQPSTPVEIFEGHEDVVKEFVWRKGGHDFSEFQLITWSKDKTLRFWPVDTDVMQRAGRQSPTRTTAIEPHRREMKVSFSNPPMGTDLPPALSAPIGHRGILAEVRAPFPPRPQKVNPVGPSRERGLSRVPSGEVDREESSTRSKPIPITQEKGGTMTRGNLGGRSAQINTLVWLSSIKVGGKREASSGPGNGVESGEASRRSSRSKPPSLPDRSASQAISSIQRNNDDSDKTEDVHPAGKFGRFVHDEITSVVNKLSASKVKLEKADLSKKRTCTFGLHGPWGESTSVFIRISFTFPPDYPQAAYPNGIPRVDLEKSPLISMKSRAFILRRLRTIREHQRPCLENCLRFLLFGDEDEHTGRHMGVDSESSSDEDALPSARNRNGIRFTLLRGDKNLAEPRTSQGVFGVNGELVCFFRAPPRIVRNMMRDISVSPSVAPRAVDTASRQFRSPVSLSDAIFRLAQAAHDRNADSAERRQADDANDILRIMTNLFTFSQQKPRMVSEHSRPFEDAYSLLPTRRSTVFIKDASALVGTDVGAAQDYSLATTLDPPDLCRKNAEIAGLKGRTDHERIFKLLEAVFTRIGKDDSPERACRSSTREVPVLRIVSMLYYDLSASKDIQMLAMMSLLLLHPSSLPPLVLQKTPDKDTSQYRRPLNRRNLSLSPIWSRTSPSPTFQPVAPPLSSPSSSKGSWSSLFNTGSMRQFVAGSKPRVAIPVPGGTQEYPFPSRSSSRDTSVPPTPPAKSWSEATSIPPIGSAVTFSSAGHTRRPTFSQVLSARPPTQDKKRIVLNILPEESPTLTSLCLELRSQLLCHIFAYAEVLQAWRLPGKRSELLKSVERAIQLTTVDTAVVDDILGRDRLGCARVCAHGISEGGSNPEICSDCAGHVNSARCTICRLPVKGLSHICPACSHVTHVTCWNVRQDVHCASGCGCQCAHLGNTASYKLSLYPT